MTKLIKKIIELLPEEMTSTPSQRDERDAYNQCLQDVKEKLPEILKLIREEVMSTTSKYQSVDKKTKELMYSGGGTCRQCSKRRDSLEIEEVLELLK